jgi:hypothetical protein
VTTRRQTARRARPRPAPAPEVTVVFLPPATPEAREDAWRRLVDALDWLATLGAMDS